MPVEKLHARMAFSPLEGPQGDVLVVVFLRGAADDGGLLRKKMMPVSISRG